MASSFQNLTINDTGYLQLPSGTSASRPSLFSNTAIQWTNTGTQSYSVLAGSPGTVSNTSWTCPTGVTSIELLIVAGGGGGGINHGGGGGGAGGVIYNSSFPVTPGTAYTVTVGTGGSSGTSAPTNGGNSSFGILTALGGGYGASESVGNVYGNSGGSGGGAGGNASASNVGGAGTPGQGFAGANKTANAAGSYSSGSGGGGAGGPGFSATTAGQDTGYAGDGGPGLAFSISGTTTYYGGGGGGGYWGSSFAYYGKGGVGGGGNGGAGGVTDLQPTAGAPSTGGGGGGSRGDGSLTRNGAAGGSGIVIIRYTLADSSTQPYGQTRFNTDLNILETYTHNNRWEIQPTGEKIVTNGLIMYLDGSRYNTNSTTTWYDQSGNGNNGTLVSSPTYTLNYGGGFTFVANTSWVNLPNGLLQGAGDYTINMWVQPGTSGSNTLIASYPSSNLQLFYNSGTTGMYLANSSNYYSNNAGDYVTTSPVLITSLRRGTRLETYINGSLKKVGDSSSSMGSSGTIFRLAANTNGGEGLNGTIYVCQVYNRALILQEITQNYTAQAPRFVKGNNIQLAGWKINTGKLTNNNLVWYSQQGTSQGYNAVIWNQAFERDFTLICSWRHDYIGMGVWYGPAVSPDGFTGYSSDATGPYAGGTTTSGFASGYTGTFYGQYHAPITGQGATAPLYYFKWQRQGNVVTMQYSTLGPNGPWTDNNSANRVVVTSYDKVMCNIGEAGSNEYAPLTFISLVYN